MEAKDHLIWFPVLSENNKWIFLNTASMHIKLLLSGTKDLQMWIQGSGNFL